MFKSNVLTYEIVAAKLTLVWHLMQENAVPMCCISAPVYFWRVDKNWEGEGTSAP